MSSQLCEIVFSLITIATELPVAHLTQPGGLSINIGANTPTIGQINQSRGQINQLARGIRGGTLPNVYYCKDLTKKSGTECGWYDCCN